MHEPGVTSQGRLARCPLFLDPLDISQHTMPSFAPLPLCTPIEQRHSIWSMCHSEPPG